MADESDLEKTEAATPRRLEKAREEGQVARSRELSTFLLLMAGVGGLWVLGGMLYDQLGTVMEQSFQFDRALAFDPLRMLAHVLDLGRRSLITLMPLMILLLLTALAAPMLLGGWLFSSKALLPQFSRLNPLQGLQRLLSTHALAELAKALAKALLIGTVAVKFISGHVGEMMALMGQPLQQALANLVHLAAKASALIVFTLVLVIGIDVPYQLWSHARKLRMSKEDLRQEHKESEGDPHVKGRIRSQQQAVARRRMMSKVPTADVIVTNPTHYAVALAYEEGSMGAPRVVAKGTELVAQRIRELGQEHRVPLLEAPPLARALYFHVDLDQEIPGELYTAVAEVMAWAYRLKRVRVEGGEVPPTPHDLPVPAGFAEPGRRRKSEESQ